MMQAFVPELELGDGAEPTVAVAWLEHCDPLVRERLQAAAETLHARAIDFPLPEDVGPMFMREVAEVHRDLFAEHADSYGDNVRAKVERCLAVTDSEYEAAKRRRAEYRERCEAVLEGFDLLLAPTLAFVAPPLPDDERSVREAMIRFTFPFNCLGWPALALPAGPAEHGLPSSVQIVGRAGDDSLVLATGLSFEASGPYRSRASYAPEPETTAATPSERRRLIRRGGRIP